MKSNPFSDPSQDAHVLAPETCQRLHYRALRAALSGLHAEALPSRYSLSALKQQVQYSGPDTLLIHPEEIAVLFEGVTTAVFRTVKTLYCSRFGRSIHTVWQILSAMARAAGVCPLSYETVWVLCMALQEPRREAVTVNIEHGQEIWWIGGAPMNFSIQTARAIVENPLLLCCVDTSGMQVLSFHFIAADTLTTHIPLVLYDAIISQRRPHPRSPTGLLWHLPKSIEVTAPLSQECLTAWKRAQVQITTATRSSPLLHTLQERWEYSLHGSTIQETQCTLILDNYLKKTYGYGPLHEHKQREIVYLGLRGYSQNPAWQFPLLRTLLPSYQKVITQEGVIVHDGLHYTDPLLAYWPEHTTTIRCAVETEAMIWVYLDNTILCQAHASELRRTDGSYRSYRPV